MRHLPAVFALAPMLAAGPAAATLVSLGDCQPGITCTITDTPPNPVVPDPNDDTLLAWDEQQNVTLLEPLRVDRVFDASADFIAAAPDGDFFINAGTVVSSHYLQYDGPRLQSTISLDGQIFAVITADQNLFDSDPVLGLPGLDYADFAFRGLESGDSTDFNGESVDIDWSSSSPGDWVRLITAFSPIAEEKRLNEIPLPPGALLLGTALAFGVVARRRAD